MKNLLSFSKGSFATNEEMHMAEKIRALAARYATGETAELLTVLVAYAKINGPPRKISKALGMNPVDYGKALTAAALKIRGDGEFNNLFHFIRATVEDAEIAIPRFPAAAPYSRVSP